MERAFVAERPEIELERFELDAKLVRDKSSPNGREVRLSGTRANAGEFRTLHADLVVAPRPRVGKCLQFYARRRRHGAILAHPSGVFQFVVAIVFSAYKSPPG